MKMQVSSFAERFTELRKGSPESDSELASRLGFSRQTISAWHNGSRIPHGVTIEWLAQEMGVNPDWLNGYDAPKYTSQTHKAYITEDEDNLIRAYRGADPMYKQVAIKILEDNPKAKE